MFCSNCGKEIDEGINFCSHCGTKTANSEVQINEKTEKEEYVIFSAKKHWITLVPCYIFGLLSLMCLFSGLIILVIPFLLYGIFTYLRYKFDKIEITNKSFNLQWGILNVNRINMPLDKINTYYINQSFIGQLLNYGSFVFQSAAHSGNSSYNYITNPNKLIEIMNNIEQYISEHDKNLKNNCIDTQEVTLNQEEQDYLKFRKNLNIQDEN